jgi:hypothetical protein
MGELFDRQMAEYKSPLAELFEDYQEDPKGKAVSVASELYNHVLSAGGNHRQGYAMLVDECGAEIADEAVTLPWWKESPASCEGHRLYGESRAECALREAGLIGLDD